MFGRGAYYLDMEHATTQGATTMTVRFDTSDYRNTHGTAPRGHGFWAFIAGGETRFVCGPYSSAKAEAKRWATEQGHTSVKVGA